MPYTSSNFRFLAVFLVLNFYLINESVSFAAILPSPVASWDFNDSIGDTLRDVSGNNHHGIIHGASWVKGVEGHGLEFKGHEWVEVPANSSLQSQSFSLSVWLRQSGNASQSPLLEFQRDSAQAGVHLWANTSGWGSNVPGSFFLNLRPFELGSRTGSTNNNNLIFTEGGAAKGCRWNHVVLTFDKITGVSTIYLNGKIKAKKSFASYVPDLSGSLIMGYRMTSSLDNYSGLGLIGILDNAEMFNIALSESQILAIYNNPNNEPKEIHLGMSTHYAKAGNTIWVPLYISNEGKDSLSSVQFFLDYDTTVVELIDMKTDSTIAKGWKISSRSESQKVPTHIGLLGAGPIRGAMDSVLVEFKFKVLPQAKIGASTMLVLKDPLVDEGQIKALSSQSGEIFVYSPEIFFGDINDDGKIDLEDAEALLCSVTGEKTHSCKDQKKINITRADVSRNGKLTAYDAALILQFSLGLIDDFPVNQKVLAKRSANPSILFAQTPVHLSGDGYRYRFNTNEIAGNIGGEFLLKSSTKVSKINSVTAMVSGVRLSHSFDSTNNQVLVAFAANRKVKTGVLDFFQIDATLQPGVPPGSFELMASSLNENGSLALIQPRGLKPESGILKKIINGQLQVSIPNQDINKISLINANGRQFYTSKFKNAGVINLPSKLFSKELTYLKIETMSGKIYFGVQPPLLSSTNP